MPIVNEGLTKELEYVTRPSELNHIQSIFDKADPLMQEMAYALIIGDQHEVDRLTRQALDEGFFGQYRAGLWARLWHGGGRDQVP